MLEINDLKTRMISNGKLVCCKEELEMFGHNDVGFGLMPAVLKEYNGQKVSLTKADDGKEIPSSKQTKSVKRNPDLNHHAV